MRIGLTDPPGAALFRYYRDGGARQRGRLDHERGPGGITANWKDSNRTQYEIEDQFSLESPCVAARGPRAQAVERLNVAGRCAWQDLAQATPS